MTANAEVGAVGLDKAKLAASVVLLIVGIFGFYHFAAEPLFLRVLALLVIAGFAGFVALQTDPGRRLWQFASDSRMEVRKVVWPSRQETMQTTLVVFVMVLILSFILWLFDMMLMGILRFLTGQGG